MTPQQGGAVHDRTLSYLVLFELTVDQQGRLLVHFLCDSMSHRVVGLQASVEGRVTVLVVDILFGMSGVGAGGRTMLQRHANFSNDTPLKFNISTIKYTTLHVCTKYNLYRWSQRHTGQILVTSYSIMCCTSTSDTSSLSGSGIFFFSSV